MDESGQGQRNLRGTDVEGQSNAAGKSPGDSAIEAFSLFKTYLDSTLKEFKTDLNCSQKKEKKEINFKNEANKKQYLLNSEIMDELEGLRRLDLADRVSDTIDNVCAKLKHRNKILLVADSSPGTKDVLDRRKHEQSKRSNQAPPNLTNSFHPYKRTSSFVPRATGSSSQQTTSQIMPQRWGSGAQQPVRDYRPSTWRDICFSCGRRGHFRSECRASDAFLRRPSTQTMQQDSRSTAAADK